MSELLNQKQKHKLLNLVQNTIDYLGFEVVKLTLFDRPQKLEILIDRKDEQKISIDDCQLVSRNIAVLLDVENIIDAKYYLVVSSAGMERPLTKIEDYQRFLERDAKIELMEILNGSKRYQGKLVKVEDNKIYLQNTSGLVEIPFDKIKNAKLVLTEAMLSKILNG